MDCPVCKKSFDEYTGRRQKKFCSDECKVKFWNAKKSTNKKEKSLVEEEKSRENPFVSAARGRDGNGVNSNEVLKAKFKVYDYSSIPEGTPYNKKKVLMANLRAEQDKQ